MFITLAYHQKNFLCVVIRVLLLPQSNRVLGACQIIEQVLVITPQLTVDYRDETRFYRVPMFHVKRKVAINGLPLIPTAYIALHQLWKAWFMQLPLQSQRCCLQLQAMMSNKYERYLKVVKRDQMILLAHSLPLLSRSRTTS